MPVRTHYDVLGVRMDASDDAIRAAYRRLAREHHPDRAGQRSSAAGGLDMPAINEAYRVLGDPGRRVIYDRSLRASDPPAMSRERTSPRYRAPFSSEPAAGPSMRPSPFSDGPARVPWRSLLAAGTVAILGVVVLAQFTEPGEPPGPDGILRNGDCVELLPNGDAREVGCTGSAGEWVVRAFVTFDGTCPGFTEAHRDRQGMGVACLEPRPEAADGAGNEG